MCVHGYLFLTAFKNKECVAVSRNLIGHSDIVTDDLIIMVFQCKY